MLCLGHLQNFIAILSQCLLGYFLMAIKHVFVGFVACLVKLIFPFVAVQEVAVRPIGTLLLLQEVGAVLGRAIAGSYEPFIAHEVIQGLNMK